MGKLFFMFGKLYFCLRNLNYTISTAFHPQLKANKYLTNISFLSFIPKITTDDKDDTQGLFFFRILRKK